MNAIWNMLMLDSYHVTPQPNYFSTTEERYEHIASLHELLTFIAGQGYRFTTVTPLTHERYLRYSDGKAKNLCDIFGWNLPFEQNSISPMLLSLMTNSGLLHHSQGLLKSSVRISSLGEDLFLHSSFPTNDTDAVFFGPDTYRFARFIQQSLKHAGLDTSDLGSRKRIRILDVGCGSGAGGVVAVRALSSQQPYSLFLNDINYRALDYAVACTQFSAIDAQILPGNIFDQSSETYDLIVSNPPYMADTKGRLYRNGGDSFGLELSLRIVRHALQLLAPDGHLFLYTGVAMMHSSVSPLVAELAPELANGDYCWSYEEIDPDIFGEELEQEGYRKISRIAAIGLHVHKLNETTVVKPEESMFQNLTL